MTTPPEPAPVPVSGRHRCPAWSAAQFATWIARRGGVAVWRSAGTAAVSAAYYTPLLSVDGIPFGPPRSDVGDQPAEVITDPAMVDVVTYREFERFRVGVRHGAQRLSAKIDDEGTRRIEAALARAVRGGHADAVHQFDYQTHEVTIFVPESVEPLSSLTGCTT